MLSWLDSCTLTVAMPYDLNPQDLDLPTGTVFPQTDLASYRDLTYIAQAIFWDCLRGTSSPGGWNAIGTRPSVHCIPEWDYGRELVVRSMLTARWIRACRRCGALHVGHRLTDGPKGAGYWNIARRSLHAYQCHKRRRRH